MGDLARASGPSFHSSMQCVRAIDMSGLVNFVVKWIVDKLGLLVAIVGILIFGAWVHEKWGDYDTIRQEIEWVTQILESKQESLDTLDGQLAELLDDWKQFLDLETQTESARQDADRACNEFADLPVWARLLDTDNYINKKLRCETLELEATALEVMLEEVRQSPVLARHKALIEERDSLVRSIDEARSRLEELQNVVDQTTWSRISSMVAAVLPLALKILLVVLVTPLLIRTLLFFAVAPLASRQRPIRVIENGGGVGLLQLGDSGVSVSIELSQKDELLVRNDFLKSAAVTARKQTQWFLNASLPFASLASGMAVLTRIRPEGDASTRVTVGSNSDLFGQLALIELPAGAAMVIQPRSLAGVVKQVGSPVEISSHWRLTSLHAWLTLQLRYLAFHGPCMLVLKGCGGVCADTPNPEEPRLINQASTLGFSANLEYQTIRSEVFVPYLRGQVQLFDDLFSGGPGSFVYEEVPAGLSGGALKRGLNVMWDAFCKAIGI